MKSFSFLVIFSFVQFSELPCQQGVSAKTETAIQGQVYERGHIAITGNWTPPPLTRISTIIVSDTSGGVLKEVKTDSLGAFNILLPPGRYLLLVKDRMFQQGNNGPFIVKEGRITVAKVYHDNGMR